MKGIYRMLMTMSFSSHDTMRQSLKVRLLFEVNPCLCQIDCTGVMLHSDIIQV